MEIPRTLSGMEARSLPTAWIGVLSTSTTPLKALRMASPTLAAISPTAWIPLPMLSRIGRIKFHTEEIAFLIASQAGIMTFCQSHMALSPTHPRAARSPSRAGFRMLFQANDAATWIPFHAAWTMFRNVSEFLYASTMAATRATMMAMTRPMGLALMAALRAHWATVMAPVMAVPATMATFCATNAAVERPTDATVRAELATQAPAVIPAWRTADAPVAMNEPTAASFMAAQAPADRAPLATQAADVRTPWATALAAVARNAPMAPRRRAIQAPADRAPEAIHAADARAPWATAWAPMRIQPPTVL